MKKKGYLGLLAAFLAVVFGVGTMQITDEAVELFSGAAREEKITESTEAAGEMEVTFLDVGQGDCTIIRTEGHAMMVDTGDNRTGDEVAAYLQEQGISSLDYLILTHPDADHIGGGDNVLESVEVKQVLMPDVVNDTKTYGEVIQDIELYNVDTVSPVPGETYSLGDAEFIILSPEPDAVNGEYARGISIGIKLIHGENSFVMCGDAEEEAEKEMVERFGGELECDVLKCGHHGSSTSTTDLFLEKTNPTWAVISCGKDNSYGHPHAEVIAKLEADDIQIYRTDLLGTITARSDGKQISWSHE